MIKRFHIGLGILAAVILLGLITVGISVLVCYYCLAVHEYEIHIDGVEHPFTAVVLTDLHSREFGEGNETLLAKIRVQNPDVIFSIGDMINGTADEAEAARFISLLGRLREIAPVYVSYGNHEQQYLRNGGTDLAPGIANAGAILLNERCEIADIAGNIICVGGTLGHLFPFGRSIEQYHASAEYRLMTQMQDSGYPTIVLAHLPDTIIYDTAYNKWNIDLFLSGHTHGGIIRLPWFGGVYAPMQEWFPRYDMGYFHPGKIQLLISSGFASHGKIPRIFNRPEICVVHVS